MAKTQSLWRSFMDAVYAPCDYLTHNGTGISYSDIGKNFREATKPEYLATLLVGTAEYLFVGDLSPSWHIPLNLALVAVLSRCIDELLLKKLEGNYFDTNKDAVSFIEPSKASALKTIKNAAPYMAAACAINSILQAGLMSDGSRDLFDLYLPMYVGATVAATGHFWRSKQVLDGNWSITDNKPDQKMQETPIPDMA